MPGWVDAEQFYHNGDWSGFILAANREIAAGLKEPAWCWTMLAGAYEKLGKRDEAEGALRRGIERHPEEALCYAFLGTLLARGSTGKPQARLEATRLWEVALKKQAGKHSTFDHLRKEIDVLRKLASNERYPPIKKKVREFVSKLKECGFFANKHVDQVLDEAIEILGAGVVHDTRKGILESFLQLDRDRFLGSDWRFAAADIIGQAAEMPGLESAGIVFVSETDPDAEGTRAIRFSVGGRDVQGRAEGVDDAIRLLNRALLEAGIQARFYQLNRDASDDGSSFVLLLPHEADLALGKKLLDLRLP